MCCGSPVPSAKLHAAGDPTGDVTEHALDALTDGGASRSAAIRQAVLEAAARRERAAEMRRAVLRMPLGEPDGIDIAEELSLSRHEER